MRLAGLSTTHTAERGGSSRTSARSAPLLIEYPLLAHRDPDAAAAVTQDGVVVSAADFLAAAWTLLARLPRSPYVVNVCEDRFRFTVGLAAALLGGQVSLLPNCRAPESLRQLGRRYEGAYLLTDHPIADAGMPHVQWPLSPASWLRCVNIPWFPSTQTAVIVFTSGSTGEPVAHPKTWGSLVQGAQAFSRHFDLTRRSGPVVVGTVPPQHMFGLESTVMLPLQMGWAFHSKRPTLPEDLRVDCSRLPNPIWLMTTPTHLDACEVQLAALPNVEGVVSATMPLDPTLAGRLERSLGVPVYEVYGCTEGGMLAGRRPAWSRRWTLCESLRLQRDDDAVHVSGGHVGASVRLVDRITLHNERQFTLHGREGDLVKVAGKRTSLTLLNRILTSIPGVIDGAFFRGRPSKSGLIRLSAIVVAPGVTKRDILLALRRNIDPVFLPRPLHLVAELPRNEIGKLPKGQLAAFTSAKPVDRSLRVQP
ncbi:AMP-ligase [Nitrospira sp.]|nr:AMP-ligase [Nitrospira sp.]